MGFHPPHGSPFKQNAFMEVMLCSNILMSVRSPGYSARDISDTTTQRCISATACGSMSASGECAPSAPVPQAVDIDEDAVVDVVPPHDALDHIARLEGIKRFLHASRPGQRQIRCMQGPAGLAWVTMGQEPPGNR